MNLANSFKICNSSIGICRCCYYTTAFPYSTRKFCIFICYITWTSFLCQKKVSARLTFTPKGKERALRFSNWGEMWIITGCFLFCVNNSQKFIHPPLASILEVLWAMHK